jgi:glucosamine--fructose-6-phosphate aminotransferase (isomerizing)
MCGIIGYIGRSKAFPFLMSGLAKLEYRGYDSAGIAVLADDLCVQKSAGKLQEISFEEVEGNIGIAHTRWATHGKVTQNNAHPHVDCRKEIAIVHNGIIENYQELKAGLLAKGHQFNSETDSEVVAHLIEDQLTAGLSFEDAFLHSLRQLEGSYTVLAVRKGEQKLLGARKGSRSLSIGISDEGIFPASDVLAFLDWTNKVVYLKSGDVFFADDESGLNIYNLAEERYVVRPLDIVRCRAEEVKKGEFEHFMRAGRDGPPGAAAGRGSGNGDLRCDPACAGHLLYWLRLELSRLSGGQLPLLEARAGACEHGAGLGI